MKTAKVMTATKTEVKDPVCGMMVSPDSALHVERDGKLNYFCSETCKKKFLATPTDTKAKSHFAGKSR
jgi:Cu+-exporting ATPase